MPMAMITVVSDDPDSEMSAMASRMPGIAIRPSMTRMMRLSRART